MNISKEEYDSLKDKNTVSRCFISSLRCRLGHTKTFNVVDEKQKIIHSIECRCSQVGGLVQGGYVFTYDGKQN